ncbi:hypothetical protein B2G71_20700 [Novosphingobium sp. PC22D]|uniref:hypothetical protein n=1 Tax=Novosphingobium sp. PC22D TaxID=1962403 RepID=UPI000BEF9952|nr:hypothetical protein [Novosphingobium sp. PC22D]PEQ10736.1 hypothetical protein B2G71_20700 [Novosphingobium sp. PC22D]
MTNNATIAILAVIAIALVAIGIMFWQRGRMRTDKLRDRFGPEYDRTMSRVGDQRKAIAILSERERRVSRYTIRKLDPKMREHFVATWQKVQAQFVDDPSYAVMRADDLLGEVMQARGYPVTDFEHAAEDLSVDHPEVVQNYRKGHAIVESHRRSDATTDELRAAMIHYRALFDDLVNEPDAVDLRERRFESARS